MFSAIAAGAALRTSGRANRTAETVAAIERDRWHVDLTPDLGIMFEPQGDSYALLKVELRGPAGLDRLDQVVVTVRDEGGVDHEGHAGLGGSIPVEELRSVVWSQYRFRPSVDGADRLGRGVAPFALERGEWRPFAMECTLKPHWFTDLESWQRRFKGKPLRLTLECRRQGHKPWIVSHELSVPDPGSVT
ncbi:MULTISPECIES: hypothetical protein [unclassified Kitasatospora]|uniref:hypothetical protein n=1 Tax=unclassified Kitasatospora TaxID=2633591 RepID=UPI002475D1CB|nr:hypothetical protein [Kitasatospora sp. MAP12-44]